MIGSATYDAANRVQAWDGQAYTWNSNGELTNDGTNTYTWDARGHLTGISGSSNAAFSYDGLGRRETSTINGTVTRYLYDGSTVAQEESGSGNVLADYLANPGDGGLLSVTRSGSTQSVLSDQLGSALALADDSGTITAEYTYTPFGAASSTGSESTAYQYTGRPNDGTGLQYNQARYYSPTLGRFISEDPLGFAGGDVNLYDYSRDDPIDLSDPSGLSAGTAIAGGGESGLEGGLGGFGLGLGLGLGIKDLWHMMPSLGNGATGPGGFGNGGSGSGGGTSGTASGWGGSEPPCPPGDYECILQKLTNRARNAINSRRFTLDDVDRALQRGGHDYIDPETGEQRTGYYDPGSRTFVAMNRAGTRIISVFRAPQSYVDSLW